MKLYTLRSIRKVKDAWLSLYRICPTATPFQDYEVMKIAVRYFFPYNIKNLAHVEYAVISDNNNIVFIAPILVYNNKPAEIFGNVNGYNYCSVLYSPDTDLNLCFEILKKHYKSVLFSKGGYNIDKRLITPPNSKQVQVAISIPNAHDEYINSLSSSTRQNIRTAYNRLIKEGHVIKMTVLRPHNGNISSQINQCINLYCDRHLSRYGVKTSSIKRWFLKNLNFATIFYKKCSSAMTITLDIDGSLAAFMSGLVKDNVFVVPRLSINNEYRRYSPGIILINEAIKYFISDTKITILDLSQGQESYKYNMGGKEHYTYEFRF
ncbi:MAG: GNAT family N-acetyltransferase [Pseudoflavonifractor sp.]|nr:GNAT family N-acetyltransferase [Pseudoflavonifractor sp.]